MQIIFKANTKFAANIDSGLVAEDHAGLQSGMCIGSKHVVGHQIIPFVHFQAKPMPDPVREVFEAGSVSGIDNHFARGGVHRIIRDARFCCRECRLLRTLYDFENSAHLVGRRAEDKCARDVGCVALDDASVVEHDDCAFADGLRLVGTVGQGSVLTDVEVGIPLESYARITSLDQSRGVFLRHLFCQRLVNGFVDANRSLAGNSQAFDFVRALDDSAARGDRSRADYLEGRRSGARDAVCENELDGLLDADASAGDSTIFEALNEP